MAAMNTEERNEKQHVAWDGMTANMTMQYCTGNGEDKEKQPMRSAIHGRQLP